MLSFITLVFISHAWAQSGELPAAQPATQTTEQPGSCYLTNALSGRGGEYVTDVAIISGADFASAKTQTVVSHVDSVKSINSLIQTLQDLQSQGVCSTVPNRGTCYLAHGLLWTGISIKNTGSAASDRNIIYSVLAAGDADKLQLLERLKEVGVCSDIDPQTH